MTSRAFQVVWNNPEGIFDPELVPDLKYATWQTEMGDSGTPHYQMHLEFSKPKRSNGVARYFEEIFGKWPHVEACVDREADIVYCTKPETRLEGPWEWGTRNTQGKRNDLLAVQSMLRTGASMLEVAEEHFGPFVRYHRAFEMYRTMRARPRSEPTRIVVLVGPSGCGKSRFCRDQSPSAFWKQASMWWCGYDGTSDVVCDDFYGWLPFNEVLRMCDRHPHKVQMKNGQINFAPGCIYFTSNRAPQGWWSEEVKRRHGGLDAFIRRVDEFGEWRVWNKAGNLVYIGNCYNDAVVHFAEYDMPLANEPIVLSD